jgi:hypothetical protein
MSSGFIPHLELTTTLEDLKVLFPEEVKEIESAELSLDELYQALAMYSYGESVEYIFNELRFGGPELFAGWDRLCEAFSNRFNRQVHLSVIYHSAESPYDEIDGGAIVVKDGLVRNPVLHRYPELFEIKGFVSFG